MREIMPAQQRIVMRMRTLETGMRKSRMLEEERRQFHEKNRKDPEVLWTHPKDGEIRTTLDPQLIRAIEGGTNGAYRELVADGYPDLARDIAERTR